MSITTDELIWILTDYGQSRMASMLTNPTDLLYLQKIKVGDANGSYYVPKSSATKLVNELASFYIHEKSKDSTTHEVTFKTNIPESSNNYEIREVGLYETIDDKDYLFAISTQQPMGKPSTTLNYLISIDLNVTLRSTNLLTVYDRIVLDADNDYIKKGELEQLKADVLFAEGNLVKQINNNTHTLGLNRAMQLFEKIKQDTQLYSNNSVLMNYNFLTNICDIDDVYAYWVFNYTNHNSSVNIPDFSSNGFNLQLSDSSSIITRSMYGLAPYIDVASPSNYVLSNDDVLFTLTKHALDYPFVVSATFSANNVTSDKTLLAKSNKAIDKSEFEITLTQGGGVRVRLFTDTSNYIEFNTANNLIKKDEFNSIVIQYNGDKTNPTMTLFFNVNKISMTLTKVGTYTGMGIQQELPVTSYITDSSSSYVSYIDSKIGNICIIKKQLTDNQLKYLSLSNLALLGEDTCLIM